MTEAQAESLRVVVAGGGTGGHLYPGIAVARELQRRVPGAQVSFAGTERGIEARVLPREGFPLDLIRSRGLKATSLAARLRGLATLPLSAVDAWRLLSARRPHVVIGVGGYSSGPVVLLAALRGRPTLLLEQNAVPGLTNRLLARVVRAAAVTYDHALPYFFGKGIVTGNPVRAEFLGGEDGERGGADAPGSDAPVRVLIVGGSQGAHAVNVAMVEAAPRLAAAGVALALAHQTGERDLATVREAYGRAGIAATVEPFFDDMNGQLRRADLVVSRAGATTLAEIMAAGRASVLIPLPTAADDHQRLNAQAVVESGAAVMIEQRALTGDTLADRLLGLANAPGERARMAAAARRLARPDAARLIADRVLDLARGGGWKGR